MSRAKPESVAQKLPFTGLPLSRSGKCTCLIPEGLKVILTKEAFEQLFGYAYAAGTEISCLGSVRRDGSSFIVERFHLVRQDCSSAHTEMDPAALGELVEELMSNGNADEARSLKCWAHSHPGMGLFWSKTDDATCRLLTTDYLVSIVVSDDYAIRARVDVHGPVPFTIDEAPVVLDLPYDQDALERYGREVADKVKTKVFDDENWSEYFQTHRFADDDVPFL